jgi:hypothetical protein
MFSVQSAPINEFREMLDASDGSPTLVAADSVQLGPLGLPERAQDLVLMHPNPTADGWVTLGTRNGTPLEPIAVNDASGRAVAMRSERYDTGWRLHLPEAPGTYYIRVLVAGEVVLLRAVRSGNGR